MEGIPTSDILKIQAQGLQTGSVFTEHAPRAKQIPGPGEIIAITLATALVLTASKLRR